MGLRTILPVTPVHSAPALGKLRGARANLNVNGEPREGLSASIKLNGVRLSRRQIHSGVGTELDAVR